MMYTKEYLRHIDFRLKSAEKILRGSYNKSTYDIRAGICSFGSWSDSLEGIAYWDTVYKNVDVNPEVYAKVYFMKKCHNEK
jgi:hypothetical protein